MKRLLIALVLVFLIHLNTAAADSVQVQKIIETSDIKVGDDVKLLLKFTNPFEQDITVRIVDKNIFGNNGIDVQCIEYSLQGKKETNIAYDPIKPFKSGTYTLDSAEVTYTNPETGKEEIVKSNTVDVSVKDSNAQQVQTQGITTIYRCNGVNMQSTSYSSSGGSFNMQIGSNTQQQTNQQQQQQESPGNRVQNNQLNQNTNALKQQIDDQMQKQQQMEEEFRKNLAGNPDFQKQHESLLNSGYNLTNSSFNPSTNDTGDFELSYQKPNGENATLKGEMENGTVRNLAVLTDEDKQKIINLLSQNKQFQLYNESLVTNGFNQTAPVFNPLAQNHSKIIITYKNGKEEKNITAEYINGTIQNVYLEDGRDRDGINWLFFLLIILIIAIFSWIIYRKFFRKSKNILQDSLVDTGFEKTVDYLKEAKNMLDSAKRLFIQSREKDAYEKVSQAVRFYFSYKSGIKKEITNTELLNILKKEKTEQYSEIQKCLDMCSLVEFAKYKANEKDFNEIIGIAEKIIS